MNLSQQESIPSSASMFPSKVWLVEWRNPHDYYEFDSLFSTEEKAKAYVGGLLRTTQQDMVISEVLVDDHE